MAEDVASYHPAIWHTLKVGHLLATDLDRICRQLDLSVADINLLGAVGNEAPKQVRATDLAQALQVSNAVLSARIAKLQRMDFLVRTRCLDDHRAFGLELSPAGVAALDQANVELGEQANFIRRFRRLSTADRDAYVRIMAELHMQLERDFTSTTR